MGLGETSAAYLVQGQVVRDLLLLLDKVQRLGDGRVVLELVLADLEEDLDHVLDAKVAPNPHSM